MSLAIWGRERGYATLRYAPDSDQRSHNTLNALLHCLAKYINMFSRNRRAQELSEANCRARFKPSCRIQPLKIVVHNTRLVM